MSRAAVLPTFACHPRLVAVPHQSACAWCPAVLLVDGYLYQLDAHFERFKASAELAGLPLPMSEERLLRVLLDTAAASMKMNGGTNHVTPLAGMLHSYCAFCV